MLEWIYYFIRDTTKPLYTVIYQTRFFFIDYWSFVHFVNGFIIIYYLKTLKVRRPYTVLFFLLLLWEIIEIWFVYAAIELFETEILTDQITDMVIGMMGGLMPRTFSIYQKATFRPLLGSYQFSLEFYAELAVAVAIACTWVTYYDYNYNSPFFNSPGLNWFAFTCWSLVLFFILYIYKFWQSFLNNNILSLAVTWIIYFLGMLAFEYIGYYILEIRLVTNEGPLIFGLVHGSPTLKGFYLVSCFLAVFLSFLFKMALKRFSTAQRSLLKIRKEY